MMEMTININILGLDKLVDAINRLAGGTQPAQEVPMGPQPKTQQQPTQQSGSVPTNTPQAEAAPAQFPQQAAVPAGPQPVGTVPTQQRAMAAVPAGMSPGSMVPTQNISGGIQQYSAQIPMQGQGTMPNQQPAPMNALQMPFTGQQPASVGPQMSMQPQQTPYPSYTPVSQQPLPTSHVAQEYTQEQLAIAMTSLVDAGQLAAAQGIMQQFGVMALTEVPPERYPEVAVKLREAGAAI